MVVQLVVTINIPPELLKCALPHQALHSLFQRVWPLWACPCGVDVSLSLCARARDQRMNAVVTDIYLSHFRAGKSFHTSCWSVSTNNPTAAITVRVYCWSLHYRFYPGSAITIRTSPTVQPSIMLHLSILNQPVIQLTEMLSGKLYMPEGYQTFF